jgi:hypothetical protein
MSYQLPSRLAREDSRLIPSSPDRFASWVSKRSAATGLTVAYLYRFAT